MKCPECKEEIHLGMTSWELAKLEQGLEDYKVIMVCINCYEKTTDLIDNKFVSPDAEYHDKSFLVIGRSE